MSEIRLSKKQIEQLHNIVKIVSVKPLKLKGVSKAARTLGISRPTIYKALGMYPEAPSKMRKGIPVYVEQFESSKRVKEFREKYRNLKHLSSYVKVGLLAWRFLNQKDPISWNEDDFLKVWRNPDFIDSTTGKIKFNYAVRLRKWMVHLKHYDLPNRPQFSTKRLKRPKGAKRTHYLKTFDEMSAVIMNIENPSTLCVFRVGTECGGRISSLLVLKLSQIDFTERVINMYEPKIPRYVARYFWKGTLEFIRKYAYDFNIKHNEKLFKHAKKFYNADLKQAGVKAGIDFDLTSHVALKHTFVSQASAHGVPLETVCEQCGTDPQTIRDFYLGIDARKMRRDLFGSGKKLETYQEWITRLDPVYQRRYQQIKDHFFKEDGIKRKKKPKPAKKVKVKAKKKRVINWDAIEKMVKSPKTPEKLKKYWKKRLQERREKLKK